MTGAETLVSTLAHNNVEVCFANPGTSEMHIVSALDDNKTIRSILALFEGVATGAADGYSRMTHAPAATLLHLGPGMANGLSGLHNALRARVSIVNIIGDHATYHRHLDAPLTSDIEGAARPFSHWVRTSQSTASIAADTADAIGVSMLGRVASLILPADTAWGSVPSYGAPPKASMLPKAPLDLDIIESAAETLRTKGERVAILLGGQALREKQLVIAAQIAQFTGATLLSETFSARMERGAGRHATQKIPYPISESKALLSKFDAFVLIDSKPPVAFFAYPNKSSILTLPSASFYPVARPEADSMTALQYLRSAITNDTRRLPPPAAIEFNPASCPTGTISREKLAAWLSWALPENAIVLDESITTGREFYSKTMHSHAHDYLSGTGGAIGWALPVAVGAAVACPDRKVIALESDGSGMYALQSLWTYARENLNIIVLMFSNRKYQVLHNEMINMGIGTFGAKARSLLNLDQPALDWVALSRGLGVPAKRVDTIDDLEQAFGSALVSGGPYLIEVPVE